MDEYEFGDGKSANEVAILEDMEVKTNGKSVEKALQPPEPMEEEEPQEEAIEESKKRNTCPTREIGRVARDEPEQDEKQEDGREEPPVMALEDESVEKKITESKGISSPEEITEMDVSPNEPGDDLVQFDPEMNGDSNKHMVGEGAASEAEQDKAFLRKDESFSSLPDGGAAGSDKKINVLICDDQNDDGDYLETTRKRKREDREGNCYCGKDRNFNMVELLCDSCCRWFHKSCIRYQLGKLVPFTTDYEFKCKNCSIFGVESFKRNQAQFSEMCVTTLANLTQASSKIGTNIKLFSKDRDIIPFFETHWEALTTTTRKTTKSWHAAVTKTLLKDAGVVFSCQDIPGDENSPYFGLLSDDLSVIRPNYEAMVKAGQLKVATRISSEYNVRESQIAKMPRKDISGPIRVIAHGYPTEHPFNKDSYRYILAEPDPNAPFRQEFDESNEWSEKPIHGWLCRAVNPPSVLLALHDRAPQLKVSEDRLSVTGEKGYCMIRASHSVTRGTWYYEAKITDMSEGSACRIGFGQQFGNLQGPLGFDRYGYSWRSRFGSAYHEARSKSYANGYGIDDVLGFLIVLPQDKKAPLVPTSFKDLPLVNVKSHLYYEDKDDPKELAKRDVRAGSKIICFKNGVCQGVMYEDIYCGNYYPTISLYKSITVRCNFGPDFWAPPPPEFQYRGICERAEEATVEQSMADMLYLNENVGQLHLDNE